MPVTDTDGAYLDEVGKLSESTMRVQDSLYYQDFSYVIKVGQSINACRNSFKKTMHTAGFYFTGQVNVSTRLNAQLVSPVRGSVSGVSDSPFMRLINTLFSTIFGRRLGTNTDGTTKRTNPLSSGAIDSDPTTHEHFSNNQRDVTLIREPIVIDYTSSVRRLIY